MLQNAANELVNSETELAKLKQQLKARQNSNSVGSTTSAQLPVSTSPGNRIASMQTTPQITHASSIPSASVNGDPIANPQQGRATSTPLQSPSPNTVSLPLVQASPVQSSTIQPSPAAHR